MEGIRLRRSARQVGAPDRLDPDSRQNQLSPRDRKRRQSQEKHSLKT